MFNQVHLYFDAACDRWRGLYLAACHQSKTQNAIILDASRTRRRTRPGRAACGAEAESQLNLLRDIENLAQSDFYSYRYFASEGFLPGYNFPRLPLSAYIPARRTRQRRTSSCPGPGSWPSPSSARAPFIYHEGARYIINGVILPVGNDDVLTAEAQALPDLRLSPPDRRRPATPTSANAAKCRSTSR